MRVIYADNNATTQVAPEVYEAMAPFLTGDYFNPSSMYEPARRTAAAIRPRPATCSRRSSSSCRNRASRRAHPSCVRASSARPTDLVDPISSGKSTAPCRTRRGTRRPLPSCIRGHGPRPAPAPRCSTWSYSSRAVPGSAAGSDPPRSSPRRGRPGRSGHRVARRFTHYRLYRPIDYEHS